jgi:hypothetical protein
MDLCDQSTCQVQASQKPNWAVKDGYSDHRSYGIGAILQLHEIITDKTLYKDRNYLLIKTSKWQGRKAQKKKLG